MRNFEKICVQLFNLTIARRGDQWDLKPLASGDFTRISIFSFFLFESEISGLRRLWHIYRILQRFAFLFSVDLPRTSA
jgi:hypothetical protein